MTKNKYFLQVVFLLGIAIVGLLFFTISSSYFNTKEINLANNGCLEIGGTPILDIHSNLTSEYSFECKK